MRLESKSSYVEQLSGDLPDQYVERLERSANCMSGGIAALATYARGGGRKHPLAAYRSGSLIGLNTRIVDDLMDGDGIGPVDDRERFLENYLRSLNGGNPSPVETQAENAAYTAARWMGELCTEPYLVHYWEDIVELAVDEDKETAEGFTTHTRNAGGMIGELTAASLQHIDDFSPGTDDYAFAYDLGCLGMISDDIMDGDADIPETEVERLLSETRGRMTRHGATGIAATAGSFVYPWIYKGMKSAARAESRWRGRLRRGAERHLGRLES